jgi:hypothetical protein
VTFGSIYEHDGRECLGIGQSCLWAEFRIPCAKYTTIHAYLPATQQLRQLLASKSTGDPVSVSGVFLQRLSILDGARILSSSEGLMGDSMFAPEFEAKVDQVWTDKGDVEPVDQPPVPQPQLQPDPDCPSGHCSTRWRGVNGHVVLETLDAKGNVIKTEQIR